jgi:hypothetical protein
MQITCPRCRRTLSTADQDGPPVFCMYCGQKLRDTDPGPGGMQTASFTPSATDPDEPIPEPAPREVGGYRLVRFLGAGGMGAVYEAEAPGSGHRVAVKLLSSRLASNPASVERFRQEGRLASQLAHPHCVFVLAADTDAGRPYIVMELMPGRTLKDLVDQSGPLPPETAVSYILDVIDGLADAHRLGMIHRDVKPSNCFLTADGRVKVGDFGLSKSLAGSGERHLTQSGAFLGTVLFASPEQIRGDPLDYGSDVYSVCATLYYLLCGVAPYQHESVTAALAKAISEPPPPIRDRCPAVPRELERVVMAGLERDRDRRWQSLDELRDALVDLLPDRQTPARPRALIGAYLLDRIILSFLTGPAELARQFLVGSAEIHVDLFELRWLAVLIMLAYFTVGEGVFGATPGKWLLGLRVSRVGHTGPPGLGRALVRSLVFAGLLGCIFVLPEVLVGWLGRSAGGALAAAAVVAGGVGLLIQLRRGPHGYRGLHDFASGCHVTQRPLPARKLRLTSRYPSPLDAILPPAEAIPETIGGYAVRGRIAVEPSGEQVWAAEDRALGRKVLLWLRPEGDEPVPPPAGEVARPTRVRRLGRGRLAWAGTTFDWTAFAAPVGALLADTVNPARPLPWADARFLLEQLVDEFRAAEKDGSLPDRLGLSQVWVEPNGRVRLLDFPLPTGSKAEAPLPTDGHPLTLLRAVASLALEGRPRVTAGPVRAPVPPHAAPILNRLFAPDGYESLDALHHDLAATHAHPPEVTPSVRAAQLGLQAAVLAPGLVAMFTLSGLLAVLLAKLAELRAEQTEQALTALHDPAGRAALARNPDYERALRDQARTEARIEDLRDRKRTEAEARRRLLVAPQRFVLERFDPEPGRPNGPRRADPDALRDVLIWAGAPPKSRAGQAPSPWGWETVPVWVVLLGIPLAWVAAAGVLRGGVSMALTGIALVRSDGRRAYRRQCALRALLVWLPVGALLAGSVWLQIYHPARVSVYVTLWLAAVGLLPVYVVIALRYPDRPPQDRLAGTYLVPA